MTINWHDRSLAPERLWGACYRDLVQDMKDRGAWFATAGQATSWFRKRRSVVFKASCQENPVGAARSEDSLPGFRLRVYNPQGLLEVHGSEKYIDIAFDESINKITCAVGALADE